ncbi:hypothetical protein FRC0140_00396 [Corynebacterium diphtheriae]|nr:hypothetical protein FRC0140_00396 [Corynebacterium diphtheriae]CAB0846275.1 hypothetical protein FRC0376_00306 [Corynebacterium diphtheriae]CAB0892134.1 hypothetical protein FRC0409_00419 [Corynebacterium diphtheriae]CAB0995713.1 hypothetical protein FRC0538_00259 [Corynebacterium diphtheriae]CAB1030847.1 hypothetical protein FRC0543_00429 [Corynebacterium diphtheriae]
MSAADNEDFSTEPVDAIKTDVPQKAGAAEASQDRREKDHPSPSMSGGDNVNLHSAAFLMGLTRWHPAIGFFQFLADCHYPRGEDTLPSDRFSATRDTYPKTYWACVIIDMMLLVAVLIGLGIIATRIGYITLFASKTN